MTNRRDNDDSENTTAENTAAEEVASLYRMISTEQPSPHTDEKILAMAKKAAVQHQSTRSHWVKRWSTPVSIAAVIVLSVSIVSVIKQESRRAPEFSTADSVPLNETKSEARQERNVVNSVARAKPKPQPRSSLILSREESTSAAATVQKKDVQVEDATPQERPARKRRIEKEHNSVVRQSKAKNIAGALSQSKSVRKRAAVAAPMMESAVTENLMILENESDAAVEKQTSFANDSSAQPQNITNKADHQANKARANKHLGSAADDMTQFIPNSIQDKSQSQEHTTTDATKLLKEKSSTALTPAPKLTSEGSTALCTKTSEAMCLNSTQCILVITESGLQCRTAKNHCETNFSQREANAELCLLRSNCNYQPGKCQCDENDECQCGQTGPPLCEPLRKLKQN